MLSKGEFIDLKRDFCCILGAGPAGLAVAGRLAQANIPFRLIEQGPKVGWSWHNHYTRLHLHTIKEYSHLPGIPFPDDYPTYVPKQLFATYLEDYAAQLGLEPQLGESLQALSRQNDHWQIQTDKGSYKAAQVVLATGYNRIPHLPDYPGLADYGGSYTHSKYYQTGADFTGKRVLVVGMGNTGAELALDLYEQGATAMLSVRNPVNIIPRDFWGRPAQKTAILLNKLPEGIRDSLGNFLQRLSIGDLSTYGIANPRYSPSYQVRKLGKIPVIDLGTVRAIKNGHIKVLTGIDQFTKAGIRFTDGQEEWFDHVLFATGYKSRLQEFLPAIAPFLNDRGQPEFLSYEELPGLWLIGFAAPSTGILRSINQHSGTIATNLIAAYR